MMRSGVRQAFAGLSLSVVISAGLMFGVAGRVSANGDSVICSQTTTQCQMAPATDGGAADGWTGPSRLRGILDPGLLTMNPGHQPSIDLAIVLAGHYADGSPNLQIWNRGANDAGAFTVVELSAAGKRETAIPGLAAGGSTTYHDPAFPEDCHRPVQIIVNADHSVPDSNPANDTLYFTPEC